MPPLKYAHDGLRPGSKITIHSSVNLALNLFNQFTRCTPAEGWAGQWDTGSSRWLHGRNQHWRGSGAVQNRRDRRPERFHVEAGIGFASLWQRVFFVPGAKLNAPANVFEDGRHPALVGIHLHFGPGKVIAKSGVLGFDSDKVGVAVYKSLPNSHPGMIAPPGGNYIIGAIAPKTKLSEGSPQVGASVDEDIKAGHISILRSYSMVADDPGNSADVTPAPAFPTINYGDFQASVLQHTG